MARAMTMGLVAALVLALYAGAALAATISCTGRLCEGTNNKDTLFGTAAADEINGKGVDDILRGDINSNPSAVEDNDKAYGGGADFLLGEGGGGNDFIDAKDLSSVSTDTVKGGRGRDDVESTDTERDLIDRGPGTADKVRFDKNLDTIKNCERKFPQ